ncbi:MAG: hypothetical protein ABSC94_04645 [Polyangiaceae bacterium]|jgi:hypothetical protein
MPTHATALFARRHTAHAAVEQLVQAGFARNEISLAMADRTHEREFATEAAPTRSGIRILRHTGVLAALVAELTAVAVTDGCSLRVGGPLARAIADSGGLAAALVGSGLVSAEANAVVARVEAGSIVVAVHATEPRLALAVELLELSGGVTLAAA